MRVLLDTNVLVSALVFGGLPRKILRRALRGEFEVVTSEYLMTEFEDVLQRFDLSAEVARTARSEYELLAELVRPRSIPRAARDRSDDQVLAAAVSGDVEIIVTGDRDLLALREYESSRIRTPRQFEEDLEQAPG